MGTTVTDWMALKGHPAAEVFPLLPPDELEALAADIGAHGLLHPIVLLDGQILDGRNRLKACELAGVEPLFVEWDGDGSPYEYVWSENGARRHMEASQRAAVKLLCLEGGAEWEANQPTQGRPADKVSNVRNFNAPSPEHRHKQLAKAADVSPATAANVLSLRKSDPERFDQVARGEKSVGEAMRERKEEDRDRRRQENAAAVGDAGSLDTLVKQGARFATITIDPPWDWGDEGDVDQLGRSRPTYQTMPYGELEALPLVELADEDAHLYCWITNRSLPKGFALLEAWGFRYITCLTWVKPTYGLGNYFRGQTEHVLFGVKGSQALLRKDAGTAFQAPRGPNGHSSKPGAFYDLVESCSPGPFLEVFARGGRDKWTSWGAEADG